MYIHYCKYWIEEPNKDTGQNPIYKFLHYIRILTNPSQNPQFYITYVDMLYRLTVINNYTSDALKLEIEINTSFNLYKNNTIHKDYLVDIFSAKIRLRYL